MSLSNVVELCQHNTLSIRALAMHKIYAQDLCTRSMHKIYAQDPCTRSMHKIHAQDLCTRSMHKIYAQDICNTCVIPPKLFSQFY